MLCSVSDQKKEHAFAVFILMEVKPSTTVPTSLRGRALIFVPADFLCESCQQEEGCLLNQAEVNMPPEEKGGNIPEIEWGVYVRVFSQHENKVMLVQRVQRY